MRAQLALHATAAAEANAEALQADEELGPRSRRELTMYLADLRSQQRRPLEALGLLDQIAPPVTEGEAQWPYVQIIRANSLRLAGRLAEAQPAYEALAARLRRNVEANEADLGMRASPANALGVPRATDHTAAGPRQGGVACRGSQIRRGRTF